MPPGTRLAIYSGLLGGVSAGLMFLYFGGWTKIGSGTRFAFVVMLVWMFFHAIFAYYQTLPSLSELRGSKGPFVWVSCVVLFAGTDKQTWRIFCRLTYFFSYIAAVIILIKLFSIRSFSSDPQAYRFFHGFLPMLLWTAPWVILNSLNTRMRTSKLLLLTFPFAVLCLISFLSAGRSWIIISLLYMIVLLFNIRKILQKKPLMLYLAVVCTFLVVGITLRAFSTKIRSSFSVISEGLLKDTRSGQYREFFSQVSIADLLIGKGPRGTWYWGGRDYAYIDGPYTLMAFNGGLPLVVSYIIIIILPAIHVLRSKPSSQDAAPAIILLFWALALTGLSTFTGPGVSIQHYIICIYAGRCLGYLYERRNSLTPARI